MSKTKTSLPMKGLHTPRFFLWCRGFLHGKIIHTGGLDPETNTISSGYITGQVKRFHNACITRREQAEAKLAKEWAEADQLLIDLAAISVALAGSSDHQKFANESSAQARAREKAAEKRASREAERLEILKRLSEISNTIRAELDLAHDQMEATAEALLSGFAAYGHGLLLEPIFQYNLPSAAYEGCAEQILKSHEDTWNTMVSILKEVKK